MRSLSVHALLTILLSAAAFCSVAYGDSPIDLGLARPYAVLAGSAITSTGVVGTVVTGNIGIYPGTAITGFPPAVHYGTIESANGGARGAQESIAEAYDVAANKDPTATLSKWDLGGMTLIPGVYKFDSSAAVTGVFTLDAAGDANAAWTFQIGSSLLIARGGSVVFKNGVGNPDNVFWQVGSSATLMEESSMVGNIVALASITVNQGATVKGRCLARNAAVTLNRSVIAVPSKTSLRG